MNYLLISNMYPGKSPFYGSFIKNIEEGLVKNGVHVDKIVIGEYTSSLLKKVFLYLIFYIKIISFKNKYDFIHVSYPSFSFLPLLFRSCNSFLIVRLHGHDLIPNTLLSKLLFIFTYLSLKRANLVVIPSKFFQNKVYKIDKDIKTYIYPSGGIDVVKFRNHNYYINNNCLSIGYSGRVVHQKGLHILLKAISKCDFKVTVHVIGKYDYDIGYYQSLLQIQKKFNLDVRFYGYISSQELPQYYSLFQLFCFPTMYEESFGNVSIEAMASSVPVLGSRIGALPEYIIHGYNGYLSKPGCIDNLHKYLNIYNNMPLSNKILLSNNAYRTSLNYDSKFVNKNYFKYLKSKVSI